MISTAIVGLCDANFLDDISAVVGQLNMVADSWTLDEFLEVMGIQTEKHNQMVNLQYYVLAASIILNLIGKNVNATNYAEWKQRRIRSYSAPLMLPNSDSNSIKVVQSLQYAMSFYSEVRSYWQIRRRFFVEAWALSKQNNTFNKLTGQN